MFNQNKNNKIMSFDRHTLTPNLMFKGAPTSNPIVYFYNFALFFLVNTK
ncbi:unnamed protein product [Brassica napus]|uniref:(rape) hypothetical protein n=1 Tax=Brassica napus TaxID=3708 RepID=A0A816KBZ1_BRANA|nr:unnamed protein product [Brassica napus]